MKQWTPQQIQQELDKILPYVEKPARYIGGEYNSITKDHTGKITVCLIYPDAYEIGTSNLGIKLLYHILNQQPDIVCESCYAPWFDMEKELRDREMPLFSLESKTSLSDFDVLAFSFQYELIYTNFLNMLELSGIPFYSNQRNSVYPFIIAGGPAMANPEPIARFIDAICIGDGETRILEMVRAIGERRTQISNRESVLRNLTEIKGVYVPSFYQERELVGMVIPENKPVQRYIEPDLNQIDYNVKPIIPNFKAIQDRGMIEVSRGCTRGCRFCQAGSIYRPVRERNISRIVELARNTIRNTGYREFSLISLSISDYSRLGDLITVLDEQFSEHGISFSLPSLRLDTFTMELAEKVKEIRKSGLTFAVEGGTQQIRDSINKGTKEEELINVISIAKELGWRQVKLYFMIGLPCEGVSLEEEADGIIDLVTRINRQFPGMNMTVSIGTFVPKPHTPFQHYPQITPDQTWDMFNRILNPFRKNRKVNVRFNDPLISHLEGIFSRGDRELAGVIESAYQNGARFDGWSEHFSWDIWDQALYAKGVDKRKYLDPMGYYYEHIHVEDSVHVSNQEDEEFSFEKKPLWHWEIIDSKIGTKFLEKEWHKATKHELTPDCRDNCQGCLSCDDQGIIRYQKADMDEQLPPIDNEYLNHVRLKAETAGFIRFLYEKVGPFKYLSTVDMEELFYRSFVRANIPIKFSEGFNPHLRLEMGWAIPVGYESQAEVCQVEISAKISPAEFIAALNLQLPDSLKINRARIVDPPRKLNKVAHHQMVRFSFKLPGEKSEIINRYRANMEFEKVTPKKTKIIRMDEFLKTIRFENNRVIVDYFQTDGGARIQDIIQAITGQDIRQSVVLNPVIEKRYIIRDGDELDILDA